MSDTALAWPLVVDFMRRRCGLVLLPDQEYLLSARLTPIARSLGYASLHRFVCEATAARPTGNTMELLLDAMTTHETSFFRDPGFWDAFVARIVPELTATLRTARSASIWCAACSTGQEPYTVAMLLEEHLPHLAERVTIFATDVSAIAVERAQDGVFTRLEVERGLSTARRERHFEPQGTSSRVRAALARRVRWATHNLLGQDSAPRGCDVVLCRNVLIYFDAEDRARVIQRLCAATRPDGFVGVGTTELLRGSPLSAGWYAVGALKQAA